MEGPGGQSSQDLCTQGVIAHHLGVATSHTALHVIHPFFERPNSCLAEFLADAVRFLLSMDTSS
jgi:hypothetical protein